MKNAYLIFAVIVGSSLINYGQTPSIKGFSTVQQHEKTLEEKLEGTYVLIKKNPTARMMISMETLRLIDSKRDDKKEVYLFINEELTIKVLPWIVINAPDFDPKKHQN